MSLAAGRRLGPYELVAHLGAGGMGEVWRARDTRLGREVAIKVLPPEMAADESRLKRFGKEAQAASSLNHPNIVTIHDVGSTDGVSWIAMERVEGKTLRELLFLGIPPTKRAIPIATQIAEGLARAHAAGIVHRDLKPENVMVTDEGLVKILDFGLATRGPFAHPSEQNSLVSTVTVTGPGEVVGTVGYMSPEQIRGLRVDHRSDVFSFGAILYEMLSGSRAFKRDTGADTISAILKEDPPPAPQIPTALDRVVRRCLAKEPRERFQSMQDVAFALADAAGPGPSVPKRRIGNWTLVVAAAFVATALGAAALLLPRSRAAAPRVRRIAVLPFENLGAPEDEYFADGIADAVRGKLMDLSNVEVIARGSSVGYKKSTKDPRQIARELDVPFLLTGTIRWQKKGGASRVEVRPELVEVSEAHAPASRWQEPFDASLSDVFEVQAEIASRVAEALGVKLAAGEKTVLASRPTQNLEAYDAFLKGEEAASKFYFKEAEEAYGRALSLDPEFALAMLRLAEVASGDERANWIERASRHRSRLDDRGKLHLELDQAEQDFDQPRFERVVATIHAKYPDDGRAAILQSNLEMGRGRPDLAMRTQKEVLAIDPRNPAVINQIAYYSAYSGDYDRAIEYLTKYRDLLPNDANPYDSLGHIQAYCGRYKEAIANLTKAMSLKQDFWFSLAHVGVAYEGMGDYDRAVDAYLTALAASQNSGRIGPIWGAVFAVIESGNPANVRKLKEFSSRNPTGMLRAMYGSILAVESRFAEDLVEGRNEEAERHLLELAPKIPQGVDPKLVDPTPYNPTFNAQLALVKERQGRFDEAIEIYEKNASPPKPWTSFEDRRWVYEAKAHLAALVARRGDLGRAEQLLAEIHKWNPSWAPTRPAEQIVEEARMRAPKASPVISP